MRLAARGIHKSIYNQQYPEWIDMPHPIPKGIKITNFKLFFREGN